MALVLSKVSTLKAELRLAQAISEFEKELATEQKAAFRTARNASTRAPPDYHDVMRVTEEIDRNAAALLNSRRCFGPRVTNVLHAVQQFAALGDVIIGGSQNILACGVWSLVRMTLLTAVKFSSYLEQLSALLMNIGRSAPRYERLKELYPQSRALQSHLYEYFIVVVQLCHHVLKLTKRSSFRQVVAFLSDADMKIYQSELDGVSALIKEEMTLLMAKEIREQGWGVKSLVRSAEAEVQRQRLERRNRVLDACSTYDHETTWKETRKLGTATWFQGVAEYKKWKVGADSATLICTGKLGSGKSVLLANIVGDLSLHVQNTKCPVAYFFCRDDIFDSLQPREIIGSLARQLLRYIPDLTNAEEDIVGAKTSPLGFDTVLAILRRALPATFEAYFVLDGLDECREQQRRDLIEQLYQLQEVFTLRVCIACRSDVDCLWTMEPESFCNASVMTVPENNPEIQQFIRAELVDRIASRKLVVGNPGLVLEIEDALIAGSQGMFLWVALQIQSICAAKTDETIRCALKELPRSLPETFFRILKRSAHEQSDRDYQTRIFELVISAFRPLTTGQLREALSVTPGHDVWDPARLLNNVYSALACCGSLVMVDEEDQTVRLIHHSVKQFLLSGAQHSTGRISLSGANRTMRATVFTYLNYGVFDTQLSTAVAPQLPAQAVPSRILHSMDTSSFTRNIALKLLKSRGQREFDIGKYMAEANRRSAGQPDCRFPFHSYANMQWLQHAYNIPENELLTRDMLFKLINRRLAHLSGKDDECQKLAFWAAAEGNLSVLQQCLDNGVELEVIHEALGTSPLFFAAANGRWKCARTLASLGANVDVADGNGRTALSWAAGLAYYDVVEALLQHGAEVESKDHRGWTPLMWACHSESFPCERGPDRSGADSAFTARLLIKHGANPATAAHVFHSRTDISSATPLSVAVKRGDTALLEALLSADTELYTIRRGEPPESLLDKLLSTAVALDQPRVIKVLVEHGASMVRSGTDSDDNGYAVDKNVLCEAATGGCASAVSALLDLGADVNATDKGLTPLVCAARKGHAAIIRMLVQAGADLERRKPRAKTALYEAAMGGHHAAIKALVAAGADKDVKYIDMTALTRLISLEDQKNLDTSTIKLLIDLGSDLEAIDELGQTPLSAAALKGNTTVIQMLLDAGANMEHQGLQGRTPLEEAHLNHKWDAFDLLVKRGAVLDPRIDAFHKMVAQT